VPGEVLRHFPNALRPSARSRRIASGRDIGCLRIQASSSASGPGSSVRWIDVGLVGGRPRPLFSVLEIVLVRFMNNLYWKSEPEGSWYLPPRLSSNHRSDPMDRVTDDTTAGHEADIERALWARIADEPTLVLWLADRIASHAIVTRLRLRPPRPQSASQPQIENGTRRYRIVPGGDFHGTSGDDHSQ
jgi:hypothetical protein